MQLTLIIVAIIVVVVIAIILVFAYGVSPGQNLKGTPAFLQQNKTEYVNLQDGVRMHFLKKGSGSPIILIHGGGAWLYSYRHNIDALAKQHTVYALDMPGHGFTTYADLDVLNLQNFSNLINDFMQKEGIANADFVGNSWGGGWVLHFAETYPERTGKLVLIDSTGTSEIAAHDGSSWKYLSYPFVGELLVHFFSYDNVARDIRTNLFYSQNHIKDAEIKDIYTPFTFSQNLRAQYVLQRNLNWDEVEQKLSILDNPTLIVWGEGDRYIPIQYGRSLASKIKNANFRPIPFAGHVPHEELPDQVNQLLLDFLK